MRFHFYRTESLLSKFICWRFKERVSHVGVEFDGFIYCSGLSGIHRFPIYLFNTHTRPHTVLEAKKTLDYHLFGITHIHEGLSEKIKNIVHLFFKIPKDGLLAHGIFRCLPSCYILHKTKLNHKGLITAQQLYNLLLEQNPDEFVRIENKRNYNYDKCNY